MPRLYCAEHGREREQEVTENQELFSEFGEHILIVKGEIVAGAWLCDRCNRKLTEGITAYLVSAFPNWMTSELEEYDFNYESRYFGNQIREIRTYGTRWPSQLAFNKNGKL